MTEIWLSVRELLMPSVRAQPLDASLMTRLQGIHIDVHPQDSLGDISRLLYCLEESTLGTPFDLHFIEDRPDAETIVESVLELREGLRSVYSARRTAIRKWNLAISAREIASGDIDNHSSIQRRILITAPSKKHDVLERVKLVTRAVERIQTLIGSTCEIVLDRDVDEHLATRYIRKAVAEIVVGKAILHHPSPLKSIEQLRLAWRTSQ
jgi:hypothetical protein